MNTVLLKSLGYRGGKAFSLCIREVRAPIELRLGRASRFVPGDGYHGQGSQLWDLQALRT